MTRFPTARFPTAEEIKHAERVTARRSSFFKTPEELERARLGVARDLAEGAPRREFFEHQELNRIFAELDAIEARRRNHVR